MPVWKRGKTRFSRRCIAHLKTDLGRVEKRVLAVLILGLGHFSKQGNARFGGRCKTFINGVENGPKAILEMGSQTACGPFWKWPVVGAQPVWPNGPKAVLTSPRI
jgi:hypothetical protein